MTREPTESELMIIRNVLDPRPCATARSRRWRRRHDRAADPDAVHRPGRRPAPGRADGHGLGRPGPAWSSATANAGGLGILASATMTHEELEKAIVEVKGRTDKPFGVNLRADAGDAPARCDLLIEYGVKVASFALAPKPELIAQAQGARHRRDAVDRCRQARDEGRRLGRRRGDGPGRRGRRPHRAGPDDPAAPARSSTPSTSRSSPPVASSTAAASPPRCPTAPPVSAWAPASC